MRLIIGIIVSLVLVSSLSSQESSLGNWIIYFGNKKIDAKWNWHHEIQYRNYNAIGDLEQLLLRTGIGYNLTENNNILLLGYGYILSENYILGTEDKFDVNEHRIYQQFITKQKFGRFSWQHRYRFEQRFVEEDFKCRLRYFLSVNCQLGESGRTDHYFYLSAYNEIFLNPDEVYFDRNRIYGGIGYRLNPKVKFELGYMNQVLREISRDQVNMIMSLSF